MPDHFREGVHEDDFSGKRNSDMGVDAFPPLWVFSEDASGSMQHDPGDGRAGSVVGVVLRGLEHRAAIMDLNPVDLIDRPRVRRHQRTASQAELGRFPCLRTDDSVLRDVEEPLGFPGCGVRVGSENSVWPGRSDGNPQGEANFLPSPHGRTAEVRLWLQF